MPIEFECLLHVSSCHLRRNACHCASDVLIRFALAVGSRKILTTIAEASQARVDPTSFSLVEMRVLRNLII